MVDMQKKASNNEFPVSINDKGSTGVSFKRFQRDSLFYPDHYAEQLNGKKFDAVYIRLESNNILKIDKSGNLTSTSSSWGAMEELVTNLHKDSGTREIVVGEPFEYTFDAKGAVWSYRTATKYGRIASDQFVFAPERVIEIVAVNENTGTSESQKVDTEGRSTAIISEFENIMHEIKSPRDANETDGDTSQNARMAPKYLREAVRVQDLCTDSDIERSQKMRVLCLVNVLDQASLLIEHNPKDTAGAIAGAAKRGMDLFYERSGALSSQMLSEISSKCLHATALLNDNPTLASDAVSEFINESSAEEEKKQQARFIADAPGQWETESVREERRNRELREARSSNTNACLDTFSLLIKAAKPSE